jgi:hypothetical protein
LKFDLNSNFKNLGFFLKTEQNRDKSTKYTERNLRYTAAAALSQTSAGTPATSRRSRSLVVAQGGAALRR